MTGDDPTTGHPDRRALALVLVLYCGLGVAWAVLVPPFEKPDEVDHFAYVQRMSHAQSLPVQARQGNPAFENELQQPPLYYLAMAVPYRLAAAFGLPATDLTHQAPRVNPQFKRDVPDQQAACFWLQDGTGVGPGKSYPFDLLLTRLLSLGFGAVTVLLTFRLAGAVLPGRPGGVAVGAAAIVALLPQFTFMTSSVNNDSLAWLFAALYLVLLLALRDSAPTRSGRAYLALGLTAGLALVVKSSLYPLLPLVVLVAPPGLSMSGRLRGLATWAGTMLLVGGWWFLRNQRLYGDALGRQEIINPAHYTWNIHSKPLLSPYFSPSGPFWHYLNQSFVGVFGMMSLFLPNWIYLCARIVGVVAIVGLGFCLVRVDRESRLRLGLMVVAAALAVAGVVYYNLQVDQPQGRYLFTALPAIAILGATGLAEVVGRGRRDAALGWALIGAMLLLNVYSLHFVVARYGPAAWSLVAGR